MNTENRNNKKSPETIRGPEANAVTGLLFEDDKSVIKTGTITERADLSYEEQYEEMVRETFIDYDGEKIPFKIFNPAYRSDDTLILSITEIEKRSQLLKTAEKRLAERAASLINECKKKTCGYKSGKGVEKTWQQMIGDSYILTAAQSMYGMFESCFQDYREEICRTFSDLKGELCTDLLRLPSFAQADIANADADETEGLKLEDNMSLTDVIDEKYLSAQLLQIVKYFEGVDDEFAALAKKALAEGWFEIETSSMDSITIGTVAGTEDNGDGSSRIILSAHNSFGPQVLAHELGHAFFNMIRYDRKSSAPQTYENTFLLEVPSVFYELWAGAQEGKNGYEKFYKEVVDLEGPQMIVDDLNRKRGNPLSWLAYARNSHIVGFHIDFWIAFNLEKAIYERYRIEDRDIDVQWLCRKTLQFQQEVYSDLIDASRLDPYLWVRLPNLTDSRPFYNYSYTLGYILGMCLVEDLDKAQRDGTVKPFIENYHDFLRGMWVSSTEDVCAVLGYDLTDPKFWGSVKEKLLAEM